MRIQFRFLILLFSICATSFAVAQIDTTLKESPVHLEWVVSQNASSSSAGSFVVKNNFPSRNLDEYFMRWILSHHGIEVSSEYYSLEGIEPSETKYIGLKKLFDLQMLDSLGKGLLTLQAEIQDNNGGYEPIPLIGVSVVLAEAETRKIAAPEQYHVIKVGGARIHRIANGNSVTLDIFNQLVSLDLGNGNILAGPLRPIVSYSSLSAKQEAQNLIDSVGPSRVEIDEDKLSGAIEYDLGTFGLLKLPFALSDSGLSFHVEMEGGIESPTALGIEVPVRSLGDTSKFLGSQYGPIPYTPQFGDARLGLHGIPGDTYLLQLNLLEAAFLDTRSIFTERGDVHGAPFEFQLSPIVEGSQDYVGLSSHPMEAGTHILYLYRSVDSRYGARKSKPVSSGDWLISPKDKTN